MSGKQQQQSQKLVIYQLLVRLFGNCQTSPVLNGTMEENGVGKFNDISDKALEEIKLLGATHVWYTGILEHATMTDFSSYLIQPDDWRLVKGRAGSPFAIKDYFDVSPELAVNINDRMVEFEQLISRTHKQGLRAIIDFIPNHVARNYHSESVDGKNNFFGGDDDCAVPFHPQNNYYYILDQSFAPPADYFPLGMESFPDEQKIYIEAPAKVTGNNVISANPGTNDWFETVKLNFGIDIFNGHSRYFDPIPKTWLYMKEVLLFWTKKGVDGFRCDMAEMVPVEFWSWVIPQIKMLNPDVDFIAEIYQPDQYRNYIDNGRFDYIYDKAGLYDKLCAVLKGDAPAEEISACIEKTSDFSHQMLCFLENHDETRVASKHFVRNAWAAIPAMAILSTVNKGPVMVYFGQEVGETADERAGFGGGNGRTTIYDYWNVPELQKWVNKGAFDGAALSSSQLMLRNYYQQLLNIANRNEAVVHGGFLVANDDIEVEEESTAKSKFLYAYYRYTEAQKLLIIVNFNREKYFTILFNMKFQKWQMMNGSRAVTFLFKELLSEKSLQARGDDAQNLFHQSLQLVIPPSGALIYSIEEIN